jgi:hypothetical protein
MLDESGPLWAWRYRMLAAQKTYCCESGPPCRDRARPTVALGLPLEPDQLEALHAALGPTFDVQDIRHAPPDSAVVVVPPCSPGAIRAVLQSFPGAQVLVAEMNGDAGAGSEARVLSAGAAGYVRARDGWALADSVREAQDSVAA